MCPQIALSFVGISKGSTSKPAWLTVTRKHRKPSKHEIKSVLKFLASNGGRKGGKARWKDMSPEERSEFMRRAALKRWSQEKDKRPPSAS
jgi:hypothetical protein